MNVAWNSLAARLDAAVPHGLIALGARVGAAAIFFFSGRTKVDGLLTVNDNAVTLFREEYRLPVLSPEFAAHMAAYAEHLFPLLLAIGLFSRLSAAALLGMTAVIQLFVYPAAWPTHLVWAVVLLYVVARGPGPISLDRVLGLK